MRTPSLLATQCNSLGLWNWVYISSGLLNWTNSLSRLLSCLLSDSCTGHKPMSEPSQQCVYVALLLFGLWAIKVNYFVHLQEHFVYLPDWFIHLHSCGGVAVICLFGSSWIPVTTKQTIKTQTNEQIHSSFWRNPQINAFIWWIEMKGKHQQSLIEL